MPRQAGLSKYAPLTRYLAGLTVEEVTLTFAEIERILGTALPPSARSPSFWSTSRYGVFRVQPWVRVGWQMARTQLQNATPAVTFVRVQPS
jgi:hypothetical protein